MNTHRLLGYGCAMALVGLATPARAQDGAAAAEALFQRGREEMSAGDYASACSRFRESDRLDPAPGTKLNLGTCESSRGRWATAWRLFKQVEEELDPSDPRYPLAHSKRTAAEPRLSRLTVVLAASAPPDTTVRVGEATLGQSVFGLPLILDPGPTELLVTAPGRAESRVTVLLEEGKSTRLEVAPGAAVVRTPPAPSAPQTPASSAAPSSVAVSNRSVPPPRTGTGPSGRTLGFVAGGIGVGGLVMAGIAGGLTLDAKHTNRKHCDAVALSCEPQGIEAARSGRLYGTLTTVGLVVGALGVGVGAVLIFGTRTPARGPTTELRAKSALGGGQLELLQHW